MYKKNIIQGYRYGIRVTSKINLAMKLSLILLLASTLQVSANIPTYAQRINLQKRQSSLEEVLQEIRHQSGYFIFYDVSMVRKATPVTLDIRNATLEEALSKSLNGQGLGYSIVDKNIVIAKLQSGHQSKTERSETKQQQFIVSGDVSTDLGSPLGGVTVRVQGTQYATTTDNEGNFSIDVRSDKAVLTFTLLGYTPVERAVVPGQRLSIVLQEEVSELGEVVVTALGISREKRSLS